MTLITAAGDKVYVYKRGYVEMLRSFPIKVLVTRRESQMVSRGLEIQ